MDFANFFESIRARDIRILLKRDWAEVSRGFPKADIDRIAQIVCKDEALTVGAPSSPVLSNAVLSPLDSDIHGVCVELGCAYSRYADDLFFSSNAVGVLGRVEELVTEMVEALKSPDLTLNAAKTVHTSKKHRVRVLGLILTPTGDVSIGRAKKREIKALVYRFTQDEIDTETYAYLRGYLAYLYAAEPSFIDALKKKYSVEAVDKLLRAHEV